MTRISRRFISLSLSSLPIWVLLISCGGATGGGEGTPPETPPSTSALTLRGRVDVPPLEALAGSQTKMRSIKAEREAEEPKGIKGDLYTLKGKHLGSFETNSEGEYQVQVPAENLSGNEEVVLATKSGIQKYQTIEYQAGSG